MILAVASDSLFVAGGVDDVILICLASVDFCVDFSFTWYNSEGEVILSSSRTIISSINNMSTLTLSPLSVNDSNITCCVTVAETMGRINTNNANCQSMKSIITG